MTPHVTQSILSSNIYAEKKHRQLYQEDSNWEWSNWNLRKWHLQLFSVYWNRNQVSHYPSPLLGIKKWCGGVRVGEREWGSLQNYLDSGPERALGKSHTKAFSLAVASRNPKSISPPRSEAPFPSFVLYLWSRLVILFCGPWRGWHSFSLRKCDANHWVRTNHASPHTRHFSLSTKAPGKQVCSQRWAVDP